MGRGATTTGVVAIGAVAVLLALTACGGSSSTPPSRPHTLSEIRSEIRKSLDPKLTELGASPRQIACVDRTVETSSATKIGRFLLRSAVGGGGPIRGDKSEVSGETPKSFAGAFGKGCF